MPNSLNVRFSGAAPGEVEDEHPFGEGLAQLIASRLSQQGWTTTAPEDWRDAGSSFECRRNGAELQVVLAALEKRTEWMLQIAPLRGGRLLSLLGRRPSATPLECLELARAIHADLVEDGRYTGLQWRWDGMPKLGKSTPEPVERSS